MKRRMIFAGLILFALSACHLPTSSPTPNPVRPTEIPRPTLSPVPPSPTPIELDLRVRDEKVNCRFGPGVVYAFVNELQGGQTARVLGRNASSTWWYIRDPGKPGGVCWVSAAVTEIAGDAETLPVVAAPFVTVTDVRLRTEPIKILVACDQFPQTVFFESQVTANGPTVAQWRLESSSGYVSVESELVFEEAGMKLLNGYYQVEGAGDYWIRLHILKPNEIAAQINFPANCSP